MNEADILAMTYEDCCIIERLSDIEDSETGIITRQEYAPIHEGQIPCALSHTKTADKLAVVDGTDLLNITTEEYRLFLRPENQIQKGDRITVIQNQGMKFCLYAKMPFYYVSHCEVDLTGRDPNG